MRVIRFTDGKDTILQHFDGETIVTPDTLPDALRGVNFLNAADCSDWVRLWYMTQYDDALWIDNDCIQAQPYEFSFRKPYCANMIGDPDIWVCYSGNKDFWTWIYNRLFELAPLKVNAGNIICVWLRGMRNKINIIPNGYFIHKPKEFTCGKSTKN